MVRSAVDLEELDATVVKIGAYVEYLEDKLHALDQRVASLRDGWTGDAAEAQRDAHSEWTAVRARCARESTPCTKLPGQRTPATNLRLPRIYECSGRSVGTSHGNRSRFRAFLFRCGRVFDRIAEAFDGIPRGHIVSCGLRFDGRQRRRRLDVGRGLRRPGPRRAYRGERLDPGLRQPCPVVDTSRTKSHACRAHSNHRRQLVAAATAGPRTC
ncbi:hypothetical protein CH300_17840 [Rhodococcus sp. 15-1154-1]|nr:hypothetical protein CH300_17840 [Rhodococcus sp. 15-1154-1]